MADISSFIPFLKEKSDKKKKKKKKKAAMSIAEKINFGGQFN